MALFYRLLTTLCICLAYASAPTASGTDLLDTCSANYTTTDWNPSTTHAAAAADRHHKPIFPATTHAEAVGSTETYTHADAGTDATKFQLLIGIKSSLVDGAASRQAIRETWASALPVGVRVVFLGCEPDFAKYTNNSSEAQRLRNAITAERIQFGDLLVEELFSCRDAYDDLVNKVLAFFQWTTATHSISTSTSTSTKSFVMVADDDVYIRIGLLKQLLQLDAVPPRRFYGGQVWATQYGRAMEPHRDQSKPKYYLPYTQYAMSQLPPFANGPHYIVSADVARFLGEHRDWFRGVGGASGSSVGTLDDVSVAIWLLGMQIHPRHLPQFSNLRDVMCRNNVVSYADLTPYALQQIHSNLRANRRFCRGFSYATWLKREPMNDGNLPAPDKADVATLQAQWDALVFKTRVRRLSERHFVLVQLEISLDESSSFAVAMSSSSNGGRSPGPVRVAYWPFSTSFSILCDAASAMVASKLKVLVNQKLFFCEQLRSSLLRWFENGTLPLTPALRPILTLLIHNIASNKAPVLRVAIATSAQHAMVVLECVLAHMYAGAEIMIIAEDDTTAWKDRRAPDFVVFAATGSTDDHAPIQSYTAKYAATSRLVMLGPVTAKHPLQVDDRVIVLTPQWVQQRSQPQHQQHQLYLPVAALAFGASEQHSPMALLRPSTSDDVSTSQRFCVDDYAPRECDQPHRQYFFTLLNGLDHVDTVGACHRDAAAHSRQTKPSTSTGITPFLSHTNETTPFSFDHQIALFTQYKFVIAFEDTGTTAVPGFVSEKIVAAFLAGSIPIYYGHSHSATTLFNARAFIDCGAFATLRACAHHVLAVHASSSLYTKMRQEPPVTNMTAFVDAFSWHPDVVAMVERTHAAHSSSRGSSSNSSSSIGTKPPQQSLFGAKLKRMLDEV